MRLALSVWFSFVLAVVSLAWVFLEVAEGAPAERVVPLLAAFFLARGLFQDVSERWRRVHWDGQERRG